MQADNRASHDVKLLFVMQKKKIDSRTHIQEHTHTQIERESTSERDTEYKKQ